MNAMAHVAVIASVVALAGCSWDTSDPASAIHPSSQTSAPLTPPDAGAGSGSHSGGGDARDAGRNQDPVRSAPRAPRGRDCESNVCFLGAKGGSCSLICTSDTQCPAGEDGTQHCNPHGYCRY